jgi:hypothetical protein
MSERHTGKRSGGATSTDGRTGIGTHYEQIEPERAMAPAVPLTRSTRLSHRETKVTVPISGTAFLLIDVINDLASKGSQVLVAQAEPMALRLARLERRTAAAGVPSI